MSELISSTWVLGFLQLALVAAPLWQFAKQDLAKYRVRETTLLWLLGLSASAAILTATLRGDLLSPILGGVAFFAATFVIREIAYRATGTEAFGPADVFLAGCAGMLLGAGTIFAYLFMGSLIGVLIFLWRQKMRKRKGKRPFNRLPAGPGFILAQVLLMSLAMAGVDLSLPLPSL